jgi:hypothetical protein
MDGDLLLNGEDFDIDGDGPVTWNGNTDRFDVDMNNDGIINSRDPDMNQNGIPNGLDLNMDSDWLLMYK